MCVNEWLFTLCGFHFFFFFFFLFLQSHSVDDVASEQDALVQQMLLQATSFTEDACSNLDLPEVVKEAITAVDESGEPISTSTTGGNTTVPPTAAADFPSVPAPVYSSDDVEGNQIEGSPNAASATAAAASSSSAVSPPPPAYDDAVVDREEHSDSDVSEQNDDDDHSDNETSPGAH
jgi:hypothetical protein